MLSIISRLYINDIVPDPKRTTEPTLTKLFGSASLLGILRPGSPLIVHFAGRTLRSF
jgi:hypothetical protein